MKTLALATLALVTVALSGCTVGTAIDPATGQRVTTTSITVPPADVKTVVKLLRANKGAVKLREDIEAVPATKKHETPVLPWLAV